MKETVVLHIQRHVRHEICLRNIDERTHETCEEASVDVKEPLKEVIKRPPTRRLSSEDLCETVIRLSFSFYANFAHNLPTFQTSES